MRPNDDSQRLRPLSKYADLATSLNVQEPGPAYYNAGAAKWQEPPAAWWNYFWQKLTKHFQKTYTAINDLYSNMTYVIDDQADSSDRTQLRQACQQMSLAIFAEVLNNRAAPWVQELHNSEDERESLEEQKVILAQMLASLAAAMDRVELREHLVGWYAGTTDSWALVNSQRATLIAAWASFGWSPPVPGQAIVNLYDNQTITCDYIDNATLNNYTFDVAGELFPHKANATDWGVVKAQATNTPVEDGNPAVANMGTDHYFSNPLGFQGSLVPGLPANADHRHGHLLSYVDTTTMPVNTDFSEDNPGCAVERLADGTIQFPFWHVVHPQEHVMEDLILTYNNSTASNLSYTLTCPDGYDYSGLIDLKVEIRWRNAFNLTMETTTVINMSTYTGVDFSVSWNHDQIHVVEGPNLRSWISVTAINSKKNNVPVYRTEMPIAKSDYTRMDVTLSVGTPSVSASWSGNNMAWTITPNVTIPAAKRSSLGQSLINILGSIGYYFGGSRTGSAGNGYQNSSGQLYPAFTYTSATRPAATLYTTAATLGPLNEPGDFNTSWYYIRGQSGAASVAVPPNTVTAVTLPAALVVTPSGNSQNLDIQVGVYIGNSTSEPTYMPSSASWYFTESAQEGPWVVLVGLLNSGTMGYYLGSYSSNTAAAVAMRTYMMNQNLTGAKAHWTYDAGVGGYRYVIMWAPRSFQTGYYGTSSNLVLYSNTYNIQKSAFDYVQGFDVEQVGLYSNLGRTLGSTVTGGVLWTLASLTGSGLRVSNWNHNAVPLSSLTYGHVYRYTSSSVSHT
jgi:hypothetical protein